jgi:hypothetical protein
MRSRSSPTDPGFLRRLYVDERLSAIAIATRLGCSGTTILRRLRRLGIGIRPRGPVPPVGIATITWHPDVAYALGLMATDGNLSSRRGTMSLVSKDPDQIQTLRKCLRLQAPVTTLRGPSRYLYRVQWHDRGLHSWFLSVGLTLAKSRTIGPLAVPDALFADFFRGCVDGECSVLVYTDRYHAEKRAHVSLVSASRTFLEWIQGTIRKVIGVGGAIHSGHGGRQHPVWALRYAKAESIRLLQWMHYAPDVPCLAHKRAKAVPFLAPLGHASVRSAGRPRVGWLYTVPGQRQTESGPGWCNGSHAGLKIQCP